MPAWETDRGISDATNRGDLLAGEHCRVAHARQVGRGTTGDQVTRVMLACDPILLGLTGHASTGHTNVRGLGRLLRHFKRDKCLSSATRPRLPALDVVQSTTHVPPDRHHVNADTLFIALTTLAI